MVVSAASSAFVVPIVLMQYSRSAHVVQYSASNAYVVHYSTLKCLHVANSLEKVPTPRNF